ncbi:ribonuclease HII [Desulfitispora alkaliphila]|uniref:ribonuclease HII n=1 Tax=Desulfitispora alkaliphila TaxID=622674 RepID=UPI003D249D52
MTVKEINELVRVNQDDLDDFQLKQLRDDSRLSVQKIYHSIQLRKEKMEEERKRVQILYKTEEDLWKQGVSPVAGIDEAGRGPLAGPVVAAAVIFDRPIHIPALNDSKKLSEKKRYQVEELIKEAATAWATGVVDAATIDTLNIAQASFLAMKLAIKNLNIVPKHILVDGFNIPGALQKQTPLIKGDQISASIAAASIIAKCTRDRIMSQYSDKYPFYNFEVNKGYGTKDHYQNLRDFGLTPIHRKTFIKL